MALIASRITAGFERIQSKEGFPSNPSKYPLTPNVAFAQGDLVVLTNGLLAKAAAGAANIVGAMAAAVTIAQNPANPVVQAYGFVYDNPLDVFRATFTGHRDASATGGSATTLVDTVLGSTADSRWIGAVLYVYAGSAAGSIRTVTGYTDATRTLTVGIPFPVAIDATSQYILLGAAAAGGDVINVGSFGVNLTNSQQIAAGATIAAEAGPLVVVGINPAGLTMDVVIRKHLFNR